MPSLQISKDKIPLWSGADGALALDVNGDIGKALAPGANPILNAAFQVDGNQDIALTAQGSVSIGIQAGAKARIVPMFKENHGAGADLVTRFSLADSLTADNVLLALELGGDAKLSAPGSFKHSVLSVNATVEAGADATYVAVRSFDRATPLENMLFALLGGLDLPGDLISPPAPGELVSFEFGGALKYSVGASAGYEVKGTKSLKANEIALSEHYALSVVGKFTVSGQIAGRFSVDVTAGSAPGFARVVVKRRRLKELQIAADVKATADLTTEGLPASGKEFLGALLGVEGRNWLNLADSLITKAGQVDSIETLKAKLDGLAMDFLGRYTGKAIDALTTTEVKEFQDKLAEVVKSYRTLDQRAVALFDRYFDPVTKSADLLTAKLDELNALTSWDRLKGEIDPALWNIVRQLTDGDPLGWALGLIPGTDIPSLPELKNRVESTLSLVRDAAHTEIRGFIALAKQEFGLDPLFDQLQAISSPERLQALANEKLGHFVSRLIGTGIDSLDRKALEKALDTVKQVVARRNAFFKSFDKILKEAAAQKFTLALHAAYNRASEHDALIDMEIQLRDAAGAVNPTGLKYMAAAGRGDFQDVLATFQPDVVKLRGGLISHTVSSSTALKFNIAGWHRHFNYESMHRVIVDTEQQIRDSGNGLITVFTTADMKAESERRKRGSKSEEAMLSSFLLRVLGETNAASSSFDEQTRLYAIDVITGTSARYSVMFNDTNTSSSELDAYLEFAEELGLDAVGATRSALEPFLEERDGRVGRTKSEYDVRFAEAAIQQLLALRPTADDVRRLLRRIVFANYFGAGNLSAVGWLYASDRVRELVEENPNGFVDAESVLLNADIDLRSPIPGIAAPDVSKIMQQARNKQVRIDVVMLSRIERRIIAAFEALTKLLTATGSIRTSELENAMKAFGKALNAFDGFDNGENSVFAVFDGLLQMGTSPDKARSSSLTFTSTKDGAERTKVFALQAAEAVVAPQPVTV
ncbi:MAG: hypothetical protein ACRD3G_01680 [Vicinamibacterales bacterium]